MTDSINSDKWKELPSISKTVGEIGIEAIFQDEQFRKRLHDETLKSLLLRGYKYVAFAQHELFTDLAEQQRAFLNVLCDFKYYPEHEGGGLYVTSAAMEIYMGLLSGRLSRTFTLTELKRFIICNDTDFRDDWKSRLELLGDAGIDTKTADITTGAGPGTSASGESIEQNIAGMCTPSELMKIYGIPQKKEGAFTKALQRWRYKNQGSPDYDGHRCPAKNQHRYRYRGSAGAVQDIIKRYTKKG